MFTGKDMEPGQRIVVRTPDRHEYRGRLVEAREIGDGRQVAVVRLDTGWVTTFPLALVHPDESEIGGP